MKMKFGRFILTSSFSTIFESYSLSSIKQDLKSDSHNDKIDIKIKPRRKETLVMQAKSTKNRKIDKKASATAQNF